MFGIPTTTVGDQFALPYEKIYKGLTNQTTSPTRTSRVSSQAYIAYQRRLKATKVGSPEEAVAENIFDQ